VLTRNAAVARCLCQKELQSQPTPGLWVANPVQTGRAGRVYPAWSRTDCPRTGV